MESYRLVMARSRGIGKKIFPVGKIWLRARWGAERVHAVSFVFPAHLPAPAGTPRRLGRPLLDAQHARAEYRRWNPQRHTAATALLAAQRWGLALLIWQALGAWLVADAWDL
jgi:hypothetical protein